MDLVRFAPHLPGTFRGVVPPITIADGRKVGDRVVRNPSVNLEDGVKVAIRSAPVAANQWQLSQNRDSPMHLQTFGPAAASAKICALPLSGHG
jgi:hypothetical protein